ncbi:MAG: hypothetical protein ISN26_05605 [Betaproteobacteria bacterium AqS2]|uniref:Uncharacterized protein n=1 Tax=Candidatus Amphirhobacter heronislandensis TaxID=1732024 RepID=A0A930Y1M8_9GAMM|nr:hypothetical protein [Betaproteobacteria bacterium AqS2]
MGPAPGRPSGLRGVLGNRHVIVALLVAPILALIAYFAVDAVVSEPPQAAEPGATYPLANRPDCRWASGRCTLKNEDVELVVAAADAGLVLTASIELQGVLYSLDREDVQADPEPMELTEAGNWRAPLPYRLNELDGLRLRLVAATPQGTRFYGETGLKFLEPAP